jgi:hypothetical protein
MPSIASQCYFSKKKKVPERRSGLHPSEKELPERRSGAVRHKNTPGFIRYASDAQPVFRGTPVCRRGHLGVPRNFHLSL